MSEHINKYKRRLSRNGDNVGEVYANNTIAFIEATFSASPTFRVLEVFSAEFPEIKQIDARVVEVERMGTLRQVLFRPNQGLNIGTYVKFDNETWLVFDKWGSTESTKIKVMVEKTNRTLKWKDVDGEIQDVNCIAMATPLGSKSNQGKNDIEWNKFDVRLPIGQLFVYLELNEVTKTIKMNQRFIFGSIAYEVFGIDDITNVDKNGFGIIQLTIKVTTKQEMDDFENRIAFNKFKTDSSSVERLPLFAEDVSDGAEKGGRIW
jgi:hypothetical protein